MLGGACSMRTTICLCFLKRVTEAPLVHMHTLARLVVTLSKHIRMLAQQAVCTTTEHMATARHYAFNRNTHYQNHLLQRDIHML